MTAALIKKLQNPALYDHPITEFQLIETHISWVLLTGDYVYKLKKPVDFGFLDFSSLDKRHHFCEQELALNRRLAPQIYLDVVAISGSPEAPQIGGDATPIEYAIKMRQFPQEAQLDRVLARGGLKPDHIDQLALRIASFHAEAEVAQEESLLGDPAAIRHPVQENFDQIRPLLTDESDIERLKQLERWSLNHYDRLIPFLLKRKEQGHVRNGHGDMHLANIALIDDLIVIFDCIEFNDEFRWIDVISEIAFTTMDLDDRGHPELAARLLNAYLQQTGDYEGLKVFNFYRVYRALVRAKVACLRGSQPGLSEREKHEISETYQNYITLAENYAQQKHPTLFIAHGVSGSGKTTLTQPLLEQFGMIRIRSDVERKRLFGFRPEEKTDGSIYSKEASQKTYDYLAELAASVVQSGLSVIVDATFLKKKERQQFRQQARQLEVSFVILHFYADVHLLRQWINERQTEGKDASEATVTVLDQQLATEEPLNSDEADRLISIDTSHDTAVDELIEKIEAFTLS